MQSDTAVIEVDSISKIYPASNAGGTGFFRNLFALPDTCNGKLVINSVSFKVGKGETVGIIGRNGAGKSTLLQIITGILKPTSGRVIVRGNIAAMLELGAGFNSEFTGRENIRLSLALAGLDVSDNTIEQVADFSELGDYIDRPLKTYSSGMFAKLAFSVNIALKPDVLIVDEALSVGDVFFQSKCIKWMDKFRAAGGTVLFVTHDTFTVERICDRVIFIDDGRVVHDGNTKDGVKLYYQSGRIEKNESIIELSNKLSSTSVNKWLNIHRDHITGNGDVHIDTIQIYDDDSIDTQSFQVGDWANFVLRISVFKDLESFDVGVGIRDKTGVLIGGAHSFYLKEPVTFSARAGDTLEIPIKIKLDICPGDYLLLLGVANNYTLSHWVDYYSVWDGVAISVSGVPSFWGVTSLEHKFGVVSNA